MSKSNMQKILENRNKGKDGLFNPKSKKENMKGTYNPNPKSRVQKIMPSNKVFYYIRQEINDYQINIQQNYNLFNLERLIF